MTRPATLGLALLPLLAFLRQDGAPPGEDTGPAAGRGAGTRGAPAEDPEPDREDVEIEVPDVDIDDPSSFLAEQKPNLAKDLPALGNLELEELDGVAREAAEFALYSRLEQVYFLTCDLDSSNWLSFRELRDALDVERDEFFQYDIDKDGRIGRGEWRTRYWYVVDNTGGFPPPEAPPRPVPADPGMPLSFDFNSSGVLEIGELARYLEDLQLSVEAHFVLRNLDKDRNGTLGPEEVEALMPALTEYEPESADVIEDPVPAPEDEEVEEEPTSVIDLFGERFPRETNFGVAPMPARIVGPVGHFHRLDFDGDGHVSEDDLMDLLRPASVGVRAAAVIAAFDGNGNGTLEPDELTRAFESPTRR